MLRGLAILLLFQLAGESIAFLARLPVPGPVIGMVLLFVAMLCSRGKEGMAASASSVSRAAEALLDNLGMFFVPAGVGVAALLTTFGGNILPIAALLVLSALATLVVTVWVFILTRHLSGTREQKP